MNWMSDNVNALSLLGAAVIVVMTVFVVGKYVKQMRDDTASGELAEDNWDGIGEYKNPPPLGRAVVFLATMMWAIWYWFVGYPLNAYSQIGEWNEEVADHSKRFEAKWSNPDKETLMGMGEGVFLVQCAPCHGITGDGINGKAASFAVWGTAKGVEDTIKNGSMGLGYPLGEVPAGLVQDAAEIKAVSEYVAGGMKTAGKGAEVYATYCASCHGDDGKGMGGQSPNLTTYSAPAFVVDVLERGKKGRIGHMPAFNDGRLTKIQKEAVGLYVLSLGK